MAKLKDKIENALNETRILILGAQVFIGIHFRLFFEKPFEKLAPEKQWMEAGALGLMLVGMGLLMAPAPYHRIVERGEQRGEFLAFVNRIMAVTLVVFAISLGTMLYLAVLTVAGESVAMAAGAIGVVVALVFWYGIELFRRARWTKKGISLRSIWRPMDGGNVHDDERKPEQSDLTQRIKEVLIEARIVLPGAQALLGFQFIIFWMEPFEKLPLKIRYAHLGGLLAVAICTVLLMTPAASPDRVCGRGHGRVSPFRKPYGLVVDGVPGRRGVCGLLGRADEGHRIETHQLHRERGYAGVLLRALVRVHDMEEEE